MEKYHTPVLLYESVNALNIRPDGTYVDATFGGGGHSSLILSKLGPKGKLVAFDRDDDAARNAPDDPRFILINHNFRFIKNFLQFLHLSPVDGILADLGISSHQIDEPERGFAHRFEGPLDMRMDRNASISAADIVNEYSEEDLKSLFYTYGEIPNSAKLAGTICQNRQIKPITTTEDLKSAISKCLPKQSPAKYLSQVFQALRIEVNGELLALECLLKYSPDLLSLDGRLVVISYHSLEDRMVKNFLQAGNFTGTRVPDLFGNFRRPFKPSPQSAITPSDIELEKNNRARSAKMRIGIRIHD